MISSFFNSSAVVTQVSTTPTTMGGMTKTYSTRIEAVDCRLSTKETVEGNEFGKLTVRTVLRLYCAASATNKAIEVTDRVTIGSRNFEITGIHNPGELDRHLQIDLRELT